MAGYGIVIYESSISIWLWLENTVIEYSSYISNITKMLWKKLPPTQNLKKKMDNRKNKTYIYRSIFCIKKLTIDHLFNFNILDVNLQVTRQLHFQTV